VFLVSYGWVGGFGEAVLDGATGGIRFFRDLPIFVDSDQVQKLVGGMLPESCTGSLRVLLSADVQLVRKTGRSPSIPGAPLQEYWGVRIDRLREVSVLEEG
jgi:hypothetical protein